MISQQQHTNLRVSPTTSSKCDNFAKLHGSNSLESSTSWIFPRRLATNQQTNKHPCPLKGENNTSTNEITKHLSLEKTNQNNRLGWITEPKWSMGSATKTNLTVGFFCCSFQIHDSHRDYSPLAPQLSQVFQESCKIIIYPFTPPPGTNRKNHIPPMEPEKSSSSNGNLSQGDMLVVWNLALLQRINLHVKHFTQ